MKISKDSFHVYIVSFPTSHVRGCVRLDSDGFASIYINASLSYAEQKKVFLHELTHLVRNDFYNERSIEDVERIAL